MGKKSTPAAPDYTGAAQQQAQSSREVTNIQNWANRPDQITPFGNETWSTSRTIDPATGQPVTKWTQSTTLTPELQAALESQQRVTLGRSNLAEDLTGRLQNEMGTPMDWSNLPAMGQRVGAQDYGNIDDVRNRAEDAIYRRMKSRLDPEWQQRQDALRTQLYNAGMKEGDAPYTTQMENFELSRGDAYQQAMDAAIMGGGQEAANQISMGGQIQGQQQQASSYDTQIRQQAIAEEMQRRGFSLNEINAALSGQQVSMPNMPNFSQATKSDVANFLGAAQAQGQYNLDAFNARQAGVQGLMSGLTNLGSAYLMS